MKKCLYLIAILLVFLSSCASLSFSGKLLEYYSDESNYVSATGVISHIKYSDNRDVLCIAFSETNYTFADNNFVLVGKNLLTAQQTGIDDKLAIGDTVTFSCAPRYFGDGYLIPLVSLVHDGETLLDIQDGIPYLLEWLQE